VTSQRDSLYAQPVKTLPKFCFDQNVAAIFDDMIIRSVPGYEMVIGAIGSLSERFVQNESLCYDLGCSTGAAAISMASKIKQNNSSIIAVDKSLAMINRCQQVLKSINTNISIYPICADIRDIKMQNASIVVLNYTLQFVPPEHRFEFLSKIYNGLLAGGILILSEKLCFLDPKQQVLHEEMHHAFKKTQGYSDLEISQKRTALEKVLIPETLQAHQERLVILGFSSVEVWFQYFNFASLIAIK